MQLSSEEIAAVREYSGPAYGRINAFLRGEEAGDDSLRRIVAALDSAIAKSRTIEELVVYRGIGEPGATAWRGRGLRVGQKRIDPAFMSTSADPHVANLFAEMPPAGLVLKIRIPAGSIALAVAPYSQYPGEEEYLLPRDTVVRVTGYDPVTRTIEVEVVGNE